MRRTKTLAAASLLVLVAISVGVTGTALSDRTASADHATGTFDGTDAASVPLSTPPRITSFVVNNASPNIGTTVYFNVSTSGGVGWLNYSYSGLPVRCSSRNVSSLPCYLSEVQHFVITVTVDDRGGNTANASVNLTVHSGYGRPPTITSFTVDPATVLQNHLTTFAVVAQSHSTVPSYSLSVTYIGLPTGCTTFNVTQLSCIPAVPGIFLVHVMVTDAFGTYSLATTTLNVTPGPSPPTPTTTSGPMFPPWLYAMLGFVIVIATVGGALLMLRRPRRPRPLTPADVPTPSTEPERA